MKTKEREQTAFINKITYEKRTDGIYQVIDGKPMEDKTWAIIEELDNGYLCMSHRPTMPTPIGVMCYIPKNVIV